MKDKERALKAEIKSDKESGGVDDDEDEQLAYLTKKISRIIAAKARNGKFHTKGTSSSNSAKDKQGQGQGGAEDSCQNR